MSQNTKKLNCGTCMECCRGPRELVLARDYPELDTYFENGQIKLSRSSNGDCVYLEKGCSIYETRPDECRAFDCRDFINNPNLPERVRIEAKKRV